MRSSGVRALVITALASLAAAPAQAQAQQPPRLGPDHQPYALTISGGVSLGSYEAGLNWVVVADLRRRHASGRMPVPELVGITGASAGAINALISALAWCIERDDLATLDANLFHDTWIPIGLESLLPMHGDGYRSHDGLLARKAFDRIVADIRATMAGTRKGFAFRPCSVSLGFTVTRPEPGPIALDGLPITQQRVVVPLHMNIEDGRPIFWPARVAGRDHLLGNTLYLASRDASGAVAHEDVIQALLASAAFPLAFGRVRLVECVPAPACPEARRVADRSCTHVSSLLAEPRIACEDDFVDGGVFDNVPVGVAMAQIESSEPMRDAARPAKYLYIEPENRRPAEHHAGKSRLRSAGGTLDANLAFLGGAYHTARNYELHNVLRYNPWNEHADRIGREAAALLAALATHDARRGSARIDAPADAAGAVDVGAAVAALQRLVETRLPPLPPGPCRDVRRPGFWQFADARAGAQILLRALPCADALAAAAPQDAARQRAYVAVVAQALAVIADRLRLSRHGAVIEAADYTRYRAWLLERVAGLEALVAAVAPEEDDAAATIARVRDTMSAFPSDAELDALVRDAAVVLAGIEVLVDRPVTRPPADDLPAWARPPTTPARPSEPPAPALAATGVEVARRHRCAATLLSAKRELDELSQRPAGERAPGTRARLARIRAAIERASSAAACLEVTGPEEGSPPATPPGKPGPASRPLEEARAVLQRFPAVVAPHRQALSGLPGLGPESAPDPAPDPVPDHVSDPAHRRARAQALAEAAGRKLARPYEDRELLLSTRFGPLASAYLSAFSGFLDAPLRRYDYLVGVYDGLHVLAEERCLRRGFEPPGLHDAGTERAWAACVSGEITEIARALDIDSDVVRTLQRLEHGPAAPPGDLVANRGNVARVLNALLDPARCPPQQRTQGRCLVDGSFDDFVAALERRGYVPESPYMKRALANPEAWWVIPAMYALRRMEALEERAGSATWSRLSAVLQRPFMSLEDRMRTGLHVPSVLPPRFGWGVPLFRLSLTMDWTFSGADRYRVRPLGYAMLDGRLALYTDVGLRVHHGVTPEAGVVGAWRNLGARHWLLSGLEFAGRADLDRTWKPRVDVAATLFTHLRVGVGCELAADLDDPCVYGFIGIDDPIGLAYSIGNILL
jgi:predicted acylesterase/phospholipase RssA